MSCGASDVMWSKRHCDNVMVISWGCRGARVKGMMHDNVIHVSEVKPECVMDLGQAGPRVRA